MQQKPQNKLTYLSTFISGMSEVVADNLTRLVPDGEIELLLDGVIVYKTCSTPKELNPIRLFNNTFILLKYWKNQSLGHTVIATLKNVSIPNLPHLSFKSFRIVFSKEN
jgi:hypothetical protein